MPSPDAVAALRLPLSTARWEVALVNLSITVGDTPIEGMLLVVEEGTGLVRETGPLMPDEPLWPSLKEALFSPSPPSVPARPRALRCSDPGLARRLRAELEGLDIPVEIVASTPMVDEAAASLRLHFARPTAPGITAELPRWTATLRGLCALEPWRKLPDSVVFRFEGKSPGSEALSQLGRAVGIVLGRAGEQEGVVLYESERDYDCFVGQIGSPSFRALHEMRTLCAFIDPERELDPQERAACAAAGLALPGGRMPRIIGVRRAGAASLSEAEQRLLLAAVQAIQSLCAAHLAEMMDRPCEKQVPTCLGDVRVRSTPPPRALLEVEHALSLGMVLDPAGEAVLALVIKARKADAKKIAARLKAIDSARAERGSGGRTRLSLWTGDVEQGTALYSPLDAQTLAEVARSTRLLLYVSAGGTARPRIDPRERVFSLEVPLDAGGLSPPPGRRRDPVFDQPRARWPKALDTLVRFTKEALDDEIEDLSPREMQTGLELAAKVWNAVVMEDFGGEAGALEALIQAGRSSRYGERMAAKMAEMAEHKRLYFGGDPRLFEDVRVTIRKGSPVPAVDSRLPPGYKP